MSDALKAILTSGPLWTALIAAVVGTVLLRDPTIPQPTIDLYVAVVVALLGALGVKGVEGIRTRAASIAASRIASDVSVRVGATMELGQVAFEVYTQMTRRVMRGAAGQPEWADLSESQKKAWNAAASAIQSRKL